VLETSTTYVDSSGGEVTSGVAGTTESSSSSSGAADSTTGFMSHCEVPPDTPPACWDVICEQFICGFAGGLYDDEGCPRLLCEGASDCAAPFYCSANILSSACTGGGAGGWSCEGSEFFDCVCGGSLGCSPDPRGYCLDPNDFAQQDVCLATDWSCEELPGFMGDVHAAIIQIEAEMPRELLAQARECQWQRIQRLSDECGVAGCEVLCGVLPSFTGCAPEGCAACESEDPAEVSELLQVLVDRSLPCADCALCVELDNAACAALTGC